MTRQSALEANAKEAARRQRAEQFEQVASAFWASMTESRDTFAALDARAGEEMHVGLGQSGIEIRDVLSSEVLAKLVRAQFRVHSSNVDAGSSGRFVSGLVLRSRRR